MKHIELEKDNNNLIWNFLGLFGPRQSGTRVQTRRRLAFPTPEFSIARRLRLRPRRPEQRSSRADPSADQQTSGAEGGFLEGVYVGASNGWNFPQIFESKSPVFLSRTTATAADAVVIQRTGSQSERFVLSHFVRN